MTTRLISERFDFSGGKVDRAGPGPVIRGVLLCGGTSANRRRYRKEAFAGEKVKRYNGRPVFLNHSDGRSPRRYEDKIATIQNARHRSDGMPVGDLALNPKHPFAEAFVWDAENSPRSVGMSHVAHCQTVPGRDGWEEVTDVAEVESVDAVMTPATTKGLYESTKRKGTTMKLRTLLERIIAGKRTPAKLGLKAMRLREQLAPVDQETGVEMPDDADQFNPDGEDAEATASALIAAYKAAISDVASKILQRGTDQKEGLAKIAKLIDSFFGATTSESRLPPPTDGREYARYIRDGVYLSEAERRRFVDRITDTPHRTTVASGGAPPTEGKAFARWIGD